MPFGLCGTPATFQRTMAHLLRGLEKFSAAYLDDLVIFSDDWNDHLDQVEQVLKRLRAAGLTARPSKCQFGMAQCMYLDHVVGSGAVKPEMSKVKAVQEFPVPKRKKHVWSCRLRLEFCWKRLVVICSLCESQSRVVTNRFSHCHRPSASIRQPRYSLNMCQYSGYSGSTELLGLDSFLRFTNPSYTLVLILGTKWTPSEEVGAISRALTSSTRNCE